MPILLALLFLLIPTPTRACSCASFSLPTLERCLESERVFTGTLGRHRWPLRAEWFVIGHTSIEIEVDRVWGGDVQERVLARTNIGPGSCGLDTKPGWPILVCDDGGEIELHMCGRTNLLSEAAEITAGLGPARPPAPGGPTLWRADLGRRASIWLSPLLALGLAAVLGRLSRRWGAPTQDKRLRLARLGLVVLGSALLARVFTETHWGWQLLAAMLLPWLLAAVGGSLLAFLAGRNPALFGTTARAALAPVTILGLALLAGNMRPHFPVDHPDAVACSTERAEAALASLDHDQLDHAGATIALERVGHACTDWGLGRYGLVQWYLASYYGACLSFEDHRDGAWWTCRDDDGVRTRYGWEGPW